jgi:heme exporter protein C
MITPLKPGISNLSTTNLKPGINSISVLGYNTTFDQGENSIWIKSENNEKILKAKDLKVINSNEVKVNFTLPNRIDVEGKTIPFTLIAYNSKSGTAIYPEAFQYSNSIDAARDSIDISWEKDFGGVDVGALQGLRFPYRPILNETIRNTFFHVALWMAMFVLLMIGLFYAILFLIKKDLIFDKKSYAFTLVGLIYGMLGLATGSVWAKFTWGTWWTNDVKLNMAAISMLIYVAYYVLRQSISDHDKRARLSAVYAIFALIAIVPLLLILPRMEDSLHPGNGGNPALGGEDLDNTLRLFFYPSVIGLILIGAWIAQLRWRFEIIDEKVKLGS